MKVTILYFVVLFVLTESLPHRRIPGPETQLSPFRACLAVRGVDPAVTVFEYNSDPSTDYVKYNYQWEVFNPMYTPAGYFVPQEARDVQAAVRCGRALGVPLVPKGGGHSYAKYSFTHNMDENVGADAVIVDLQKLNSISMDESRREVSIGAGNLLAHFAYSLYANYSVIIPHGTCPTVGLAGLVLGGGIGDLSRVYGLTADAIVELELVNVDGELLTVNRASYSDLFWALKGAGHASFGIVTKFTFRGYQPPKLIVSGSVFYPMTAYSTVFSAYQEFILSNPPNEVYAVVTAYNGGFTLDIVEVQLEEGGADEGLERIRAIFERFPTVDSPIRYDALNYSDFLMKSMYASSYGITRPEDFVLLTRHSHTPRRFHAKSFFVAEELGEEEWSIIQRHMEVIPRDTIVIFHQLQGAVNDAEAEQMSSFAHRKALYIVQAYLQGQADGPVEDTEPALAWLRQFLELARSVMRAEGSYPNYVDGEMEDYLERYYGSNLQRLMAVKSVVDPSNYFRGPQSIPPAPSYY